MSVARNPFGPFLQAGCVILDGGLATELERAGHDLNDPLWSAKVLVERPAAIMAVHLSYLHAGADCIATATYQATLQGLQRHGLSKEEAESVILGAVELALSARDEFWASERNQIGRVRPIVAASIGPYGAFLADGSEYRGDYSIDDAALAEFHRGRWQILAGSSVDLMACETVPSLREAQVLAALAAEGPPRPVWMSFSCRDGGHLSDGTPIEQAGDWVDTSQALFAVGVNCTHVAQLPDLIKALRSRTQKPIVVYPNAGGIYNAESKEWGAPDLAVDWAEACREWIDAGADAVGGCCRVGPDEIACMKAALT